MHSTERSLGARYVWIWRVAVALAALGVVAVFAFANLFTTFVVWDDEGYFLQAYRDHLSGRVLYDQVFAIYGPLTFFSAALVARFNPANVTHDTFRWILLPVWVAIAALLGGLVWRWTRRFTPGIATLLLVGVHLVGLAKSVGHPQVWIVLAVAGLLWLGIDSGSQGVKVHRTFWAGIIIAAILLFKVNIGVLVFVGFALAGSFQVRGWPRSLVCTLVIVAAAAAGIALFLVSPTTSEKFFPLMYLASLAATIGIGIAPRVEEQRSGQRSLTGLKWLITGMAVCVCIVMVVTLAGGTTFRALYSAYVTMPALLARNYHGPFGDAARKASILIATIGLAAAVAVFRWRSQIEARPACIGLMKAIAGAGLLCAFFYNYRLALGPSLLFLWLLVIDVPALSGRSYSNRLLLALLSPLFSLQIFPMAAEQVAWAALLPMTAAGVLLGDGLNYLARENSRVALPRLTGPVTAAITILITSSLFAYITGDAIKRMRLWRNSQPVNLQGTHWLRLPAKEADRLTLTVNGLSQNCQTVLMIPGLYSFSLWSGVPPFEEKRINSWPFLWSDEIKNNDLTRLRQQPQGCVLVSKNAYDFFKHFGGSQHKDELLPHIQQTMRPIFTVQDVTVSGFLLPPANQDP